MNEWQREESLNHNDCWALAISRALDKQYDEVYQFMKPFIEEDGGLKSNFVYGLLEHYNLIYWHVRCKLRNITSRFNEMVACIDVDKYTTHTVYIKDGKIYSYNESEYSFKDMLEAQVVRVYTKRDIKEAKK